MKRNYTWIIAGLVLVFGIGLLVTTQTQWGGSKDKKLIIPEIEYELAGGPEEDVRGFGQRDIVDLAGMFPEDFFRNKKTEEKIVALTFDDGPDNVYTPQILDVLKKHDVKATFFLVGNRCDIYNDVVERLNKEGHVIGNHSMTHPNIMKMEPKEVMKELKDADQAIESIAGYKPILFRSPYGSLNPELLEMIADAGYKIISWDVDSLDWKGIPGEEVKLNIIENVQNGSIILQHSTAGKGKDLSGTVEALDEIITILKREDYQFVTVPELLDIEYKQSSTVAEQSPSEKSPKPAGEKVQTPTKRS